MTATESLLPEIINDFFNKIGTKPTSKSVRRMSANRGKPDVTQTYLDGRV
jgi:hypothetical protein